MAQYLFAHKFAIMSYMKSISPNQPHIIMVVGLPGSGKSFFAEKFAETFNSPYISIENILPYTTDINAAITLMDDQIRELFKTRHAIIIEGVTDLRTERERYAKHAKESGYGVLTVWVQTDINTAKKRITKVTKIAKPKNTRTLSPEQFDRAAKRFTPPNEQEKPIVISGKHTYATQAKIILSKLSASSSEPSFKTSTPERTIKNSRSNIIVR